jgi:hypothetical protein
MDIPDHPSLPDIEIRGRITDKGRFCLPNISNPELFWSILFPNLCQTLLL